MLQTTGRETESDNIESIVSITWKSKSFVASDELPLKSLIGEVKFVTVTLPDDQAKEADTLIREIVDIDLEIDTLKKNSEKKKNRLDEIHIARVKSTRKSGIIMDFIREAWAAKMLPFKTVLEGNIYKAVKSKGSSKANPDHKKILDVIKKNHPEMVKEIEKLEAKITSIKTTHSGYKNFSKIGEENDDEES